MVDITDTYGRWWITVNVGVSGNGVWVVCGARGVSAQVTIAPSSGRDSPTTAGGTSLIMMIIEYLCGKVTRSGDQ